MARSKNCADRVMAIVKNSFNVSRMDGDFVLGTVSSREEDESSTSPVSSGDVGSVAASDSDSGMGSDEIDLSEFGDPGMEFCQTGNQSCSIPLELYDLTDLAGVLSMETWNECLTEKERFALAAYLPDTDQEGFSLNLKELFCGGNFFFGNPLMDFLNKLRAGFCDPRVILYRQSLNLFRRHQYYHMLRKYQNSMVGSLVEIKNVWMNCNGYGIEERLRFLNILRSQRDLCYDQNGDFGSKTDSESDDSTEAYWSKRLSMVVQSKKPSQKVPFEVFSHGSSIAMEPVRFGEEKAKRISNVGSTKPCKNFKGNFSLSFDPGTEKKAEIHKQKNFSSGFDLLNGRDGGSDWNAGRKTTNFRTGFIKSSDKKDLTKRYGRDMQNDFDADDDRERHVELPDYHGRGRSSKQEVTVASYDYDPVNTSKKPKHSNKNLKYGSKDNFQHWLPKVSQDSTATQSFMNHKVDKKPVTLNNLDMFDDWSIRGKRLKSGGHHKPAISRNSFDSKANSYKVLPAETGEAFFTPEYRRKILQCNLRDKSSHQQGLGMEYSRGSHSYSQCEETESDSSDQVEDDGDKYTQASRSKIPSTVIKARKSGIVKPDPRNTSKTDKDIKKDYIRPLDKKVSAHISEDASCSKNVKKKCKTNHSNNMLEYTTNSPGKLREESSHQQGFSKGYSRTSPFYSQSEETESDSSEPVEEDADKFTHACKSKFPSTATEAQNSGVVKPICDPKNTSRATKPNKNDFTHHPLVKKKGKKNSGDNLPGCKSVMNVQEVNLDEKLQLTSLGSCTAERKRKGSADLPCHSQQTKKKCNLGRGILVEPEDIFDVNTSLSDLQRQADRPENHYRMSSDYALESDHHQLLNIPLMKSIGKGEDGYPENLEEPSYQQFSPKRQIENSSTKKKKGKRKAGVVTVSSQKGSSELELNMNTQKKSYTLIAPTIHSGFSFSIIHLLSAVRKALVSPHIEENPVIVNHLADDVVQMQVANGLLVSHSHGHMEGGIVEPGGQATLPFATTQEIINHVRSNPGDPCILETQEPLQDLVRGALRIFSSRTAPLGAKGWKALASYERSSKSWSWIGPFSVSSSDNDSVEETSAETWCIPHKMLVKLVDAFANWLKSGQETLREIGSLPKPPTMLPVLDEKERFRDLRAQKSLNTIRPSSDEIRAYFQKEEILRYTIPDRAFHYTAVDGRKSIVAPLRRGGGKPTSKARDHFMLKPDRPPHVTVLCLVRDSAARLPGSVGTRADVCTLIRDSQFIVESVTDAQLNQVVSGALDRLHYERDPCVQFDGDRKLWVYLHRDREDEDFEDDGTSSTKKWKRQRKEATDNSDMAEVNDSNHPAIGDLAAVGSGYDFHPTLNVGSSTVNTGDNGELVYSDLRPTKENFQSYINPIHSERRQDNLLNWEALGVNHLHENKLLCQENSTNENFDDESFSRVRTAGFLSGSLL
ncbi:hypothetical protein KSP40_PGU018280 [Platanthera guangdongensis]|uniref:DEUBAD domain-containing protein n=1 Tax=Platanthera guangdongensis TaxID=2320717 RepID=A0ABR2M6W4_9ASPA